MGDSGGSSDASTTPSSSDGPIRSRFLSDFKKFDELGEGGFGKVFECKNLLDDHIYAVKRIPVKNSKKDKILREAKVFAKLNHPNIVRYYQSWTEEATEGTWSGDSSSSSDPDSLLYIAMELCDGTLEKKLTKDHIDHTAALGIFEDIVAGLCHLHEQQVVHRDLSRKNIFLDKFHRAKIGDFALSTFLQTDVGDVSVEDLGVPLYVAPEVKKGRFQFLSDIYSLGVLFFELFHPFGSASERISIISALRKGQLPDSWELPEKYSRLLMDMLSEDPCSRPCAKEILCRLSREFKEQKAPTKEKEPVVEGEDVGEDIQRQIGLERST